MSGRSGDFKLTIPTTNLGVGVALGMIVALAASSCSKAPQPDSPPHIDPAAAQVPVADPALCGTQPLQPIEEQAVKYPMGLTRRQIEDEESKHWMESSDNCMRSASFLFAKAPESTDTVVKAVIDECEYVNMAYHQHCSSLKLETWTRGYPYEGEKVSLRANCRTPRISEAEERTRLQAEAYAKVVRARAGHCWLLPRAQ
jgi:hypothetical protein